MYRWEFIGFFKEKSDLKANFSGGVLQMKLHTWIALTPGLIHFSKKAHSDMSSGSCAGSLHSTTAHKNPSWLNIRFQKLYTSYLVVRASKLYCYGIGMEEDSWALRGSEKAFIKRVLLVQRTIRSRSWTL